MTALAQHTNAVYDWIANTKLTRYDVSRALLVLTNYQQRRKDPVLHDDKLLDAVAERCEMDEILDLCQIEVDELVEILRGHIFDNRDKFNEYLEYATGGY